MPLTQLLALIWENTDSYGGYWDSSSVVVDDLIYISGNDSWTRAIDAMTGSTVWEVAITPGTYLSATIAYFDDRLFFGDQVDTYHCLDASTGSSIWSVPGVQHGSSGIADGIVFYGEGADRGYGKVVALSCDSGNEIWSYQTGNHEIFSSPAITDGVVYIAGMDWNLYAFGTGLKYTYLDDLYAQIGSNELIVTSYDGGGTVAADTINFTVSGTGLSLEPGRQFREKLVEYAYAAQKDRQFVYVSFAMNITRGCDCEPRKMKPLIQDVGVFASIDPVAIDKACFDMVKRKGKKFRGGETFAYAEEIGLGSKEYSLIEIE